MKVVKFLADIPERISLKASAHADLGEYYFKLKKFEKSEFHFRVWNPFFFLI